MKQIRAGGPVTRDNGDLAEAHPVVPPAALVTASVHPTTAGQTLAAIRALTPAVARER